MDRKQQLSNVSFGGAWSEFVAEEEALALALDRLDQAVEDTLYEDLRVFDDVADAVTLAASAHPKGALLVDAWRKALGIPNAGLRSGELRRITAALRAGIGERVSNRPVVWRRAP